MTTGLLDLVSLALCESEGGAIVTSSAEIVLRAGCGESVFTCHGLRTHVHKHTLVCTSAHARYHTSMYVKRCGVSVFP
jgi:hypothetical protein